MRRFGTVGIFVVTALVMICISPPMLVENASAASQIAWFKFSAVLFLIGLLAGIRNRSKHTELDFSYRLPRILRQFTMLATFAAVVNLSILFANLQGEEGGGAATARIIIVVAKPFFLWLENFRDARGGGLTFQTCRH